MSADAADRTPGVVPRPIISWKRLILLGLAGAVSSLWSTIQLAHASSVSTPSLPVSIFMALLAAGPAMVILFAALKLMDRDALQASRLKRAVDRASDAISLTLGYGAVQLINYSFLAETTAAGFIPFLLYLGFFPAGVLLIARWRLDCSDAISITAARFATIWIGFEVLRGELMLGGFPWHLTAHHMPPELAWRLGASIIGAYGLGWVLVYFASRGLLWLMGSRSQHHPENASPPLAKWQQHAWRLGSSLMVLGMIMGLFISPLATPKSVRLGLVQTNIAQSNKLAANLQQRVQDTVVWSQAAVDLAGQAVAKGHALDAILWPETVFTGLALDPDSLRAERTAELAYPWTPGTAGVEGIKGQLPSTFFADTMLQAQTASRVPWLVGTIAYDNLNLKLSPQGRVEESHQGKFNSVVMLDGGQITDLRYDKVELMAFGEYIPLAWRWPTLQSSITAIGAGGMEFDLTHGKRLSTFPIRTQAGESVSLVTPICFEACSHSACSPLLYRHDWLGAASRRASLLFNPTNDGWFYDHDLGRRLHLLAARWRCLELAAPMVRVANTGISCWIDSQGKVHDVIGPRQFGTSIVSIPLPDLAAPPSLYARVGHHIRWILLGLLAVQVYLAVMTSAAKPTTVYAAA